MLLSMTGLGRGEATTGQGTLQVEIRSVNHRFSEISVRLPRSLSALEARVRDRVHQCLSRGKVNVTVSVDNDEGPGGKLVLNRQAADRYVEVLRDLRETYGLNGELEVGHLINLPDILVWERQELEEEQGWAMLQPALEQAIGDILTMKTREGETVGRDLLGRIDVMSEALMRIEKRIPSVVTALRERIENRLAEAGNDLEYNRSRLETEIVIFADRTDCTEECVRLHSHLGMFRELIAAPEPAGRKLNFLLQEMNREANTIGAKMQDIEVSGDVISLKEEIERIREQVQNFE